MRRTRRITRSADGPKPKLTSGRDGNDKGEVALVEHTCNNNGPHCEPVTAPKNVSSVTCGRCVQKLVGGDVLPPPPLTPEQKAAKSAAFFEKQKAKRQKEATP